MNLILSLAVTQLGFGLSHAGYCNWYVIVFPSMYLMSELQHRLNTPIFSYLITSSLLSSSTHKYRGNDGTGASSTCNGKDIKNHYNWVGAAYKGVVVSQKRTIGREYVVHPRSLMIRGALFSKTIPEASSANSAA